MVSRHTKGNSIRISHIGILVILTKISPDPGEVRTPTLLVPGDVRTDIF